MRTRRFVAALALLTAPIGCTGTTPAEPPPEAKAPVAAPRPALAAATEPEVRAEAAEVLPFAFPQDDFGTLLRERLTPTLPAALADQSPVSDLRAAAARPKGLDRLDARPLPLLPPDAPPSPRLLAADRYRPVRLRPTVEPPRWDANLDLARPTRPPLPSAPRALVAAPDPNRVPIALIVGQTAPARPAVNDDSTLELSRTATLASEVPPREAPAASARVAIPDPFETLHTAQVQPPPPDDDPPAVASRALPAREPLPTQP